MKWLAACATILLALACAGSATSQRAPARLAFIVGVQDYRNLTDLQKTVGDAQAYARTFDKALGFKVTLMPADPTRAQFISAFGKFLETIQPGDEVTFVFAGHGWSDGAENYLALADAPKSGSEFELKSETIPLGASILRKLAERKPKVTLVVVDACRDNPFDTMTMSGNERGLVVVPQIEGTLVVFSAGPRQKALDRLSDDDKSPNSVFTRVFLPKIEDGSVPLMAAVDEAREEVQRLAATVNHAQRPHVMSDLTQKFCFREPCSGNVVTTGVLDPCDRWRDDWSRLSQSDDFDAVTYFVERVPEQCSMLSYYAKLRLTELDEARERAARMARDWASATSTRSSSRYQTICDAYPGTDYCVEAKRRIAACTVTQQSVSMGVFSHKERDTNETDGYGSDRDEAKEDGLERLRLSNERFCEIDAKYFLDAEKASARRAGLDPARIEGVVLRSAESDDVRTSCGFDRAVDEYLCEVRSGGRTCQFEAWTTAAVETCP